MTMVMETVVSKSRFKAKALEYFRWVQETGRPVVITDRGRPVLQVQPYRGAAEEAWRLLRNSVLRYDRPTDPVALEDWEAVGP